MTQETTRNRPSMLICAQSEIELLLSYVAESEGYNAVKARTFSEFAHTSADASLSLAVVDIARLIHQVGKENAVWGVFRIYPRVLVLVEPNDDFGPQLQQMRQITSIEIISPSIRPTELVSKLCLLINPQASNRECIESNGVQVDAKAIRAYRDGRRLNISIVEYRILTLLIKMPGKVFSREEIISAIWSSQIFVQPRTVDVHIGRLRKALNEGGATDLIRTVRSCGYALDPEA